MPDPGACPDELELCGLAQGTLVAERAVAVRDHIAECTACRVAVAELARTTDSAPGAEASTDEGRPRYELERLLATGGMGEVFLARDHVLARPVAIKLLHEEASTRGSLAQSRRRVAREATALARLTHPHVVAVYDQGVLDGRAFLAMEYVRGRTLRQWLAEEQPSSDRVVGMLLQAGRGLAAAHAIGIVHRDFKPDNVLVGDDGRARVTDFGLARRLESEPSASGESAHPTHETEPGREATATIDGAISGTPAYMAPEQVAASVADARSDQYAFCVTLFEALHGARPGTPGVTHAGGAQPALGRIDALLERGLRRDPAVRHASMNDLLAAIESARVPSRTTQRPRAVLLAAAGLLLALAAGAVIVARRPAEAPIPSALHAACGAGAASCPAPLVCRFADGNFCGVAGEPGVCSWPVDGCDARSNEVCGCNGVTYTNQCEAHRAGVGTAYRGTCASCKAASACADVTAGGKRTAASCNAADERCGRGAPGVCLARPVTCTSARAPVCGCDGVAYESACEARRAGTDVDREGTCAASTEGGLASAKTRITTGGLSFGAPDEQGLDARPLLKLTEWIEREDLPVFSLLISRGSVVVYELYTSSLTREHAHYVMGITSAVTSALVGAAVDRGLVPPAQSAVADALPLRAFPSAADRDRFRHVTIADVLGMSALDFELPPQSHSPASEAHAAQLRVAPDRARFALGQPLLAEPGRSFQYNDVTPMIASDIVQYAARTSAFEFAGQALFGPMDFRNAEWMHQDQVGNDNGAYGLRLRPVDMQKLGVLFLQGGIWHGKPLLPKAWVEQSLSPWVRSSTTVTEPSYGYGWWAVTYGPWHAHLARGWKGQRIAVFADQGVVITMTGALESPEDEEAIFRRIVTDHVVPSFTSEHPDAALRQPLAHALERVRTRPLRAKPSLESRMVPAIEPKERHRPFHPE